MPPPQPCSYLRHPGTASSPYANSPFVTRPWQIPSKITPLLPQDFISQPSKRACDAHQAPRKTNRSRCSQARSTRAAVVRPSSLRHVKHAPSAPPPSRPPRCCTAFRSSHALGTRCTVQRVQPIAVRTRRRSRPSWTNLLAHPMTSSRSVRAGSLPGPPQNRQWMFAVREDAPASCTNLLASS
ncbi:hypothetical protein OH76DRAFT_719111 [Lentinus brumalis]|uniref:Uncharacterized protein n=1 Tax=Lentinus brumalis TaxID=2498619 RepID=A0A371D5K8_9APHY|nr:hypothetical protein OH76DRAFT_719111 [Polyporus brumalis]